MKLNCFAFFYRHFYRHLKQMSEIIVIKFLVHIAPRYSLASLICK